MCEYAINHNWVPWIEDKQVWGSLGLSHVTGYYAISDNIIFLTNSLKNPIYEARLTQDLTSLPSSKLIVNKVIKNLGIKQYNLVPSDHTKTDDAYQILAPRSVMVWQGSTPDDCLLEVEQGLLTFRKKQNYYECIQYPGFCLSTPTSEFKDHIHLIHPISKQEKIVILQPKLQVLNFDQQGECIVKSSKDCMLLCQKALRDRDYAIAMKYLIRTEEMGSLSEDAIKDLELIKNLNDNHPDALNCRMFAVCLIKKNLLLFGLKKEKLEKEEEATVAFPIDLYKEYLTTYGKGNLVPLPIYLEKLLWKNLSKKFIDIEIAKKNPLLNKRRIQIHEGKSFAVAAPIKKEKVHYGFSKPDHLSYEDDFFPISQYHLLDRESQNKKNGVIILDKNLLPFLGSGKSFAAHFLSFYEDAKNGSKELAERLQVMRGEPDQKNRYLAWVLEQVMARKSQYPKIPVWNNNRVELEKQCYELFIKIQTKLPKLPLLQDLNLTQKIGIIFKFVLNTYLSKIPFALKLISFTKGVISVIKGPELYKFIKDIKAEKSGKSLTHKYRVKSTIQGVMGLSLKKEELFDQPVSVVDQTLSQTLQTKIMTAKNKMQALEKEALTLVDKLPQNPDIANVIRMKRLAHLENVLTMEDLMALFIVGMQKPYLDQTYLTQAELSHLENVIGQYLQQKILQDHGQASLTLYNELSQAIPQEKSYLKKKLLTLVNEKSCYEPKEYREYLVFEAMTGLRLRSDQMKNLAFISGKDRTSVVLHMIMGAGKSTVITPIAALLMAREGYLPIIVVPDSLHKTGKETTKLTVFNAFGKHAHPFEMQRDSDFSQEKLQTLLDSLKQWKEEKGFIYTTRESLLTFLLKSKELFYQYEETQDERAKAELEGSVELAWSILRELKESGAALFDEAHSLLNCRDELNFTFGTSKRVESQEAASIYDILKFLITDPQMKSLIDLQNNNQAKMSHDTYLKIVKPILVERLFHQFGVDKAYFNNAIDKVPDCVKNHPQKDLIALNKAVISTFLPHTLTKKRDEHYGLGSTNSYCIPYIGNNTPNEKAEFASYIETLLYTGYYYSQQGLSVKQLREYREECLSKSRQEQMVSKVLIGDTKINTIYKKTTGQDLSTPLDEVLAQQHLKDHPEVIFEYCLEKVLPEIVIFPNKLSANPHHLAALVKQADGMTGTPWNKNSYPSQFRTVEEVDIDQKSIDIVKRVQLSELVTLDIEQDNQSLDKILEVFRSKSDCKAVIDAGALIKDISNKEVAQALLIASNPQDVDGIVYYDEDNELMILEKSTGSSILFKDSLIPKERRVTFYDQRHTLGSDITQKRDAKALVTLSETVKKFELFQAIWRMREIDKEQTLTFLIPKKIKPLITSIEPITSSKVLDFVERNQKEQELFDNFRSRKLEIKTIVDQAMHDALMEAPTFSARLAIFKKMKDLLMQPFDIKPFDAFGGIDKEEEVGKILQDYTKKWIGVLENLAKKKAIKSTAGYIKKIQDLKPIPLNPKYLITENTSMDTQIENQVEMQVELTIATNPDAYKENIKPWGVWKWPEPLNIFKDDWMRTSSWFRSTPMPLYEAGKILASAKNSKVSSMKNIFNDTFLVSNNFLPQKHQNFFEITPEPFAWYGKPVYHLVVMQESSGKIKTLMIDQNDLPFFRDKLLQDNGTHERKICIYDPAIGITLQGKKVFNEENLKQNPDFIKHLVYAKFWNGSSKYTAEEIHYLESWIKNHGIQKMYTFFKEILRNKDTSAKSFTNSPLAAVFERLLKTI